MSFYDWMEQAPCRTDPEVMFPHPRDRAGIRRAQAQCASCPVFKACEGYAARVKPTDGVWAAQLRSGRPSRELDLQPCGTEAGYKRHWRRGEDCRICRQGSARERALRKEPAK
jgi:hypothetical protein